MVKLDMPYITGFLAFRECPHLLPLLSHLLSTHPHLYPQLLLVDGNGIFHPRGFGLACQLGMCLPVGGQIPVVGVAKKMIGVDGLVREKVEEKCKQILKNKGDVLPVVGQSGRIWANVR